MQNLMLQGIVFIRQKVYVLSGPIENSERLVYSVLGLLQVELALDVIQKIRRKLVQPVVVFCGLKALAYYSFYELRPRY